MKFTVWLCAAVLAICYLSADAKQKNAGQGRVSRSLSPKRISFKQMSKSLSSRVSSLLGSGRRSFNEAQLRRTQSEPWSPPSPSQFPQKFVDESVVLPTQAIRKLGSYDDDVVQAARRRIENMEMVEFEKRLIGTKLFADLVERARNEKPKDQVTKYLVDQSSQLLFLMHKTYGKDACEKLIARAFLDKGYVNLNK